MSVKFEFKKINKSEEIEKATAVFDNNKYKKFSFDYFYKNDCLLNRDILFKVVVSKYSKVLDILYKHNFIQNKHNREFFDKELDDKVYIRVCFSYDRIKIRFSKYGEDLIYDESINCNIDKFEDRLLFLFDKIKEMSKIQQEIFENQSVYLNESNEYIYYY